MARDYITPCSKTDCLTKECSNKSNIQTKNNFNFNDCMYYTFMDGNRLIRNWEIWKANKNYNK
jgi:hypothetical protein